MNPKFILSFLLIYSFTGFSQQIVRQSFSSFGNSRVETNGLYLSQTGGQDALVKSGQSSTLFLSQGFQQPQFYDRSGNSFSHAPTLWPNPAQGNFHVEFLSANQNISTLSLQTLEGKQVAINTKINPGGAEISLPTDAAPGIYLFSLKTHSETWNYRIINLP